jgi:hypothetical protein
MGLGAVWDLLFSGSHYTACLLRRVWECCCLFCFSDCCLRIRGRVLVGGEKAGRIGLKDVIDTIKENERSLLLADYSIESPGNVTILNES